MGHTFCSPPDPPPNTTSKTTPLSPQKVAKRKARISGCVQRKPSGPQGQGQGKTNNNSDDLYFEDFLQTKKSAAVEEYWDTKNVNTVCDLVRGDPPARTDSQQQRRRKVLQRLSQTGGSLSSARHLKRILLLRRSSSSPSQHPLKDAVALQTTPEGKKFFKIAANAMGSYGRGDPSRYYGQGYDQVKADLGETFGCSNPSVYQVNECREIVISNEGSEKEHKISKTESSGTNQKDIEASKERNGPLLPPISSLDNNEPYCFDIAEEYLRQSADNGDGNGVQHTTHLGADMGRPVRRPNARASNDLSARNSGFMDFPKHDKNGKNTERQRESTSTLIPLGHNQGRKQTHRSPVRAVKHPFAAPSRPVASDVTATSPRSLQIGSQPCPKTPRSSGEEARISTQASPKVYSRAQAPSVHSNNESDGQSEASVGMAQSAEVVRPCFYSGGSHKFPRPGPAPTGALPSLPEGHDPRTSIVILPSVDLETTTATPSPQRSVARVPGRSSAKDYRNIPPASEASEVNDDTGKLLNSRIASQANQQTPQPNSSWLSQSPSFEELHDNTLTPQTLPQSQGSGQQDWREERARSRKELKMRHLDRFRTQHDTRDSAHSSSGGWVSTDVMRHNAQSSKMRESYSSPALLASRQPQVNQPARQAGTMMKESTRPTSALSPILVVAEQAPTNFVGSSAPLSKYLPNGKRTRKRHHTQKSTYSSTATASPKLETLPLPSSDDDTACRPHRTSTLKSSSGRRSHAHTSSAHHSSLLPLQELEARVADLEKKNSMLLNAFIAVINTSAGLPARCDSSGGFSERTTSGTSGQRSSGQTLGGQSGYKNSGPDVVGVCATDSLLMQGPGARRGCDGHARVDSALTDS